LEAEVPEFDIFHVVAADTYSELDTIEVVRREFGNNPEMRAPELYASDPRASIYDITHTRDVLGWEPRERWSDVMARVAFGKQRKK
jgi:nucleoside-diphosphate-sugar epimerase